MTSRYVDLIHPIEHEMTTYPGLPGPAISTYVSREKSAQRLGTGVSFHIGRIEMVANTGTYVDAPYISMPRALTWRISRWSGW